MTSQTERDTEDIVARTATASDARAQDGQAGPGAMIAGRYRLQRGLGSGGHGEVWAADDELTGEVVAVKLLGADFGAHAAQVRREIAALRLLRLPGVVRLLDEGLHGERAFLVMDLVDGAPFPGGRAEPASPRIWPELAVETVALLETLSRVHAVGVVHRDLKPANVLVSAEGRPIILDFGISHLASPLDDGTTSDGKMLGTPRYIAPEQIRDEPVTPQTDLYAVGVMLYRALSGQYPQVGQTFMEIIRARLTRPAAPLQDIAPDVPADVAQVVDRLLSIEPENRPSSAAVVLDRLRGLVSPTLAPRGKHALPRMLRDALVRGKPLGEEALRPLFVGPDRVFYLREDAARALWARTEGVPARVVDQVMAWTRAGLARWDRERLVMDREALDRLEAGAGAERRLLDLLAGDVAGQEIAGEAVALAKGLAGEGYLGRAVAALEEGLHILRRESAADRGDREIELLSVWLDIALSRWTPTSLDRVLYELCRTAAPPERVDPLVQLGSAGLALGTDAQRAFRLAEELDGLADPDLERRRQGILMVAARSGPLESEEAVLAGVTAWARRAGDPTTLARLAGWTGRVRYRQGRFDEAAALHAEAAEAEPWVIDRIAARLNAASALLEAFRHEEARACAVEALGLARRCRHPFFSARAEWVLRAATYRMGVSAGPDTELIEAVAKLGHSDLEALVCQTEATIAFRAGQRDVAVDLATRAVQLWTRAGIQPDAVLLMRCLAIHCGAPARDGEAEELAELAARCNTTGIGIQALTLLVPTGVRAPGLDRIEPLVAQIAQRFWGMRMDVFSVNESQAALGLVAVG